MDKKIIIIETKGNQEERRRKEKMKEKKNVIKAVVRQYQAHIEEIQILYVTYISKSRIVKRAFDFTHTLYRTKEKKKNNSKVSHLHFPKLKKKKRGRRAMFIRFF